jgi:hypothetical protein
MFKKILTFVLLIPLIAVGGKTEIGDFQVRKTPGAQNGSAIFEVTTDNKGSLPAPRLTTAQRNAITSPATGLLIFNTDTGQFNVYNGIIWSAVGTTGGSNLGINYIESSDAEATIAGWNTYADAAGALPVDCTGGSPTVTFAQSGTSPLRGLNSFLFTKTAANTQGQGFSYDFTIASADKAKVLGIEFEYEVASGTWQAGSSSQDSDLQAYIYDVTNAQVIQPTPYKITGGTGNNHKFQTEFQTNSNSTSYRLCIHSATTNASAFSMRFDTVVVGPNTKQVATVISDWVPFTVTHSWLTDVTATGYYRQVGDSIQARYFLSMTGSPTGPDLTIQLPPGLSFDSTKLMSSSQELVGGGILNDSGSTQFKIQAANPSGNSFSVLLPTDITVGIAYTSAVTPIVPVVLVAGDSIAIDISAPISGWSSSAIKSQDADTRSVFALAGGTPASTTANNPIVYGTSLIDSHTRYDTSAGTYRCPYSGTYRVNTVQRATNTYTVSIYRNNVIDSTGILAAVTSGLGSGSKLISCNANDTLFIGPSATTGAFSAGSTVSFELISNPRIISASEVVAARYSSASGQVIANNTLTTINYSTRFYDTHGAVTTGVSWRFTAPMAGRYSVCVRATLNASAGWAANERAYIQLVKNAGAYSLLANTNGLTANEIRVLSGCDDVELLAGETVTPQIFQNNGAAIALSTNVNENNISISRIGGVE